MYCNLLHGLLSTFRTGASQLSQSGWQSCIVMSCNVLTVSLAIATYCNYNSVLQGIYIIDCPPTFSSHPHAFATLYYPLYIIRTHLRVTYPLGMQSYNPPNPCPPYWRLTRPHDRQIMFDVPRLSMHVTCRLAPPVSPASLVSLTWPSSWRHDLIPKRHRWSAAYLLQICFLPYLQ